MKLKLMETIVIELTAIEFRIVTMALNSTLRRGDREQAAKLSLDMCNARERRALDLRGVAMGAAKKAHEVVHPPGCSLCEDDRPGVETDDDGEVIGVCQCVVPWRSDP